MVLKKDFIRRKRKGGKLDDRWLGPYAISKDLGKGFFALSDRQNQNVTIARVNGSHLKEYRQDCVNDIAGGEPAFHESNGYFDDEGDDREGEGSECVNVNLDSECLSCERDDACLTSDMEWVCVARVNVLIFTIIYVLSMSIHTGTG